MIPRHLHAMFRAALVLSTLCGAACTTIADRQRQENQWHQACREQIEGRMPLQPSTGMWRVLADGRTQRWLVVRDGNRLYLEPARKLGRDGVEHYLAEASDYVPGRNEWTLSHYQGANATGTTLNVQFDPTCRGMNMVWHLPAKASQYGLAGSLLGYAVDKATNENPSGVGTWMPWPGIEGEAPARAAPAAPDKTGLESDAKASPTATPTADSGSDIERR